MKKQFFSTLATLSAISVILLTGCEKTPQTPVQRITGQLNQGGTYFEVYDCTKLPDQLSFLWARVRPAAEPLYDALEIPVPMDTALAMLQKGIQTAGFDRIEGFGGSSVILSGESGQSPYFFHNRTVLDTGLEQEVPAFLLPFCGAPVKMQDFAAVVPQSAVSAASFHLDYAALYRWINRNWTLPPAATGAIRAFTGCPPEDFFAGMSGRVTIITLDSNPHHPELAIQLPDQANRLYALAGKFLMLDASQPEISVPVPPSLKEKGTEIGEIKLHKGANRLTVAIGKDVQKRIQAELAAGKTFARRADFAKLTARMPESATTYGINDYSVMNPADGAAATDNAKYVEFTAICVSAQGVRCFQNAYTDHYGTIFKAFFGIIPQLQPLLELAASQDVDLIPPVEDSPEKLQSCKINLKTLAVLMEAYRKSHDGKLPEAMGLTGLRELLTAAPPEMKPIWLVCPADPTTDPAENIHAIQWLNTSYIYFGALPASIPDNAMPVLSEYPTLGHQNHTLMMLFADGHEEQLSLPDSVDNMEKLMSYLHTEKHYSESDWKVLMARGQALDRMLEKELTEEQKTGETAGK